METSGINWLPMPEQLCTVEEYLKFERASEARHEYLNGKIRLVHGGSGNHSIIIGSTLAALHTQLRKSSCEAYVVQMRLLVSSTGLYTYPDLTVVCDKPQFVHQDTLLNPTLIVEVLSSESAAYDRGKKFYHYRHLESLQECVLIEQDSPYIEHYVRQSDDQWLLSDHAGLGAVVELPSIGCTLALADVYEKVTFEEEESS